MKAAVMNEQGVLAVQDVPDPNAGPGQVVIKIGYCGICGSDVHYLQTGYLRPGAILGHEFVGRVVEVGEGVDNLAVGDRVMPGGRFVPCGRCAACQQGRYDLCLLKGNLLLLKDRSVYGAMPGAFAEYRAAFAQAVRRVPEGVTDHAAAVAEPLAVACLAVRHSKLMLGDAAVILGAGPIGLLVLQVLRVSGALPVYVAEISARRAAMAERFAADRVFNPTTCDLPAEVMQLTGVGADVVFECAGGPTTLQLAVETIREHGRIVLAAVRMENTTILPVDWILKHAEVKAFIGGHFPSAVALLAEHKVDVEPLITDVIGLGDIQSMFQYLSKPNDQIKVLVKPDA